MLVVSQDGVRELERSGVFRRATAETLVLADEGVELPALPVEAVRLPFRAEACAKQAALAAVAAWVERKGALPGEALRAAVAERLGRHGEDAASALTRLRT